MNAIVTSNKLNKALVVTVYTTKVNSKYKKRYKSKKKYTVACADSSQYKVGSEVIIVSCRPVSKTIKFKVVE